MNIDPMNSILVHKRNDYSQNGEDGIIEYIFNKLGIDEGRFIEFGAWDGKYLSNTYALVQKQWSGVYIECDRNRAKSLRYNFSNNPRITCIESAVGYGEDDNLDTLIEKYVPLGERQFDIISIDVDGLDFDIFERMHKYLPKVICVEVSAGHSPTYHTRIPRHIAEKNIGQSLPIFVDEAVKKGYFALCYTGNLFLVKTDYKNVFEKDIPISLSQMYLDFLHHLETTNPGGVDHLKRTFVDGSRVYNGFYFDNTVLQDYVKQ